MKTTEYFLKNMTEKRPYLKLEWAERAINDPDHKLLQSDGRMRYYKFIPEVGKFVRVILLEDGETLLNMFYDRNFKPARH